MLFRGTHIADASGSLSGVTYSHNRGGAYTRNRSIPVNPNTAQQQAVKSLFSGAQARWGNTLTPAQRAAWDAYALATPITNRIGVAVNVGGKGMYTRGNVPRIQGGLTTVNGAPTGAGLPALTLPGITSVTASTGIAVLTFTNTDAWATATGGALLIYASRGQSPTINSFKGPYRLAGTILGNTSTPPTSPHNVTLPFPVVAGQTVFFRAVAVTADGRLSPDARFLGVAV